MAESKGEDPDPNVARFDPLEGDKILGVSTNLRAACN